MNYMTMGIVVSHMILLIPILEVAHSIPNKLN
jgi:hypothetical protein